VLLTPDDSAVLGLLLLSDFSTSMHADSWDTLAILAQQAAIALQNAGLHERALAQASQDSLTGLLNHRTFQMRLAEEVVRAQQGKHPLALLMVDLDGFGAVNNVYGHQIGDRALRALTAALQGAVRSIDVCARYGGDEFVVILPETNAENALGVAWQVREAIARCAIDAAGVPVRLTASVGLAAFPQHAQTREELIRIADLAAYAAKHAGKDRVGRPEDALLALERDAAAMTSQLEHANMATVEALAAAVDAKDPYTRGHSQRVSAYATTLAGALGLQLADVMRVQLAGLLHDVGKIGIPDVILTKSGRLTADEFAVIQQHPEIGERMLAAVPFLREILPAVRHHHERWDGRGYPDGLSGSAIPAEAAILAVADSLDAMTSSRTYRPALPFAEARRRIAEGVGAQFDPQVVAAFERALAAGTLTLLTDAAKVAPMPGDVLPGEGSGSLAAPRTLRLLVGGQ
jgi:diguanylate cyclase (GGDEF)-like protein/putative nucleotidyltransferase with HDIG domain